MIIIPENIIQNRLVSNVTLNFGTVSKIKGNLVIPMAVEHDDGRDDIAAIFSANMFKSGQMMCVYAPKFAHPLNRRTVRFTQTDIYDDVETRTKGALKIGKVLPSGYANRNLFYDTEPEFGETVGLINTIKKGSNAIIHEMIENYISSFVAEKTSLVSYEKNYIVIPVTSSYPVRMLLLSKAKPFDDLGIDVLRLLKESAPGTVFKSVSRILFVNPSAKLTVSVNPNDPDAQKNFPMTLNRVAKLYEINAGASIGSADEVITDDSAAVDPAAGEGAKLENDAENKRVKVSKAVLGIVAKHIGIKIDDDEPSDMNQKTIAAAIDKRVDAFIKDPKSQDKNFDELVKEVESDKEVVSKSIEYIDRKNAANDTVKALSKNVRQENKIVASVLDLESDAKDTIDPVNVIGNSKSAENINISDDIKTSRLNSISKSYDDNKMKEDLTAVLTSFSSADQYLPITVSALSAVDTSDEFNDKITYTIQYKTTDGKAFTFKIDVPKIISNNYIHVKGNNYVIGKQMARLPIVKTKDNRVEITTNYQKMTIERTSGKISRKNAYMLKILARLPKNDQRMKISYGSNEQANSQYSNDFEYDEISKTITKLEGTHATLYFNRPSMEKLIGMTFDDFDESLLDVDSTPIGFDEANNLIYMKDSHVYAMDYTGKHKEELSDSLFDFVVRKMLGYTEAAFPSIGKSFVYSKVTFLTNDMPVFVLCGLGVGISSVLTRAKIKWHFSEKKEPANERFVETRFSNGYLYYESTSKASMLLDCLINMSTADYVFSDFETTEPYVAYLVNVLGQSKGAYAKGMLEINLSKMMDPITVDVLRILKLPTDIYDLLILGSDMLTSNSFVPQSNVSNFRIRGNEIIAAELYGLISKAYIRYQKSRMNGGRGAFSIAQNDLINNLISLPSVNNASVLNPILEADAIAQTSAKGYVGINLEKAYRPALRQYDRSMEGYISANATPYSGSVGISKTMIYNPKIEHIRGFMPTIPDEEINGSSVLSTSELIGFGSAAHDDPPRIAMQVGQAKHLMPVSDMNHMLIGYGVDKTIGRLIGDEFVFKAKKPGKLESIDEATSLAVLKNDDGTYDAIDLKDSESKNSNSGFYISQKYLLAVKIGEHYEAGDVLAYNQNFFKKSDTGVDFMPGTLAKVAISAGDFAFEDSCAISSKLAHRMASDVIMAKTVVIEKNTSITSISKIGDHIEANAPLMELSSSYESQSTIDWLRNLSDAERNKLFSTQIASHYTGTVIDIDVYYNVKLEDMDPSMQAVVKTVDAQSKKRSAFLKSRGISGANVQIKQPYTTAKKVGGEEFPVDGGMIITFYVQTHDVMSSGDKLTAGVALKGVTSLVFSDGEDPTSEYRSEEPIELVVTPIGVLNRMTFSVYLQMYGNKVLIELGKQIHEIATGKRKI